MKLFTTVFASALLAAVAIGNRADACSRVLYVGDTTVQNQDSILRIVGRSLDWRTPIPTNIYVYPRGMAKQGNVGENSVHWTSRYGAVYAVSYDGGITEGMNEKGLCINSLFCKGAIYNNAETENRAQMSLAVFVGWLLDMNATTDEVVAVLRERNFSISGATFDGGTVSALHFGVTDAKGNTAIFEFDKGDLNIYQGKDMGMCVLTNTPTYPQMKAINEYWEAIGGVHMLPGTVTSADRFVRAWFFDNNVVHTNDLFNGLAITRSIMANVSVPYHYTVNGEPNVSSTQWRSYSNLRDLKYGFELVSNLGYFYIDLKKCNLSSGASVMRLDTSSLKEFAGDATSKLVPHAPFKPMY
ncbi:MAG: linear amide C-N hydrolase [Muribaculum sp.]|nr:linear amide C-N hydrolase [Muribaculaceae bacterium]MCM1080519.1 linear amide C-N hydrolase [Muribaculum sp.]